MAEDNQRPDANRNGAITQHCKKKRTQASKSRARRPSIPSFSPHAEEGTRGQSQKGMSAMHAAWVGIVITVLINIGAIAFNSGTTLTRLSNVEEKLREQAQSIKNADKLETEMALVKQQLVNIGATLTRMEDLFSKGKR